MTPEESSSRHEALQERHALHLADIVNDLRDAVRILTDRIQKLEKIERRQNYPMLALLLCILVVMIYGAVILSQLASHFS